MNDKFDHDYDPEDGSVKFNSSLHHIGTYGGEVHDDMGIWDSYGIQLGDLLIHDLHSTQMIELGVAIINNLIVNGHDFIFVPTREGYTFLKHKTK